MLCSVGELKSTLAAYKTQEEWGMYIFEKNYIWLYKYVHNSSLTAHSQSYLLYLLMSRIVV